MKWILTILLLCLGCEVTHEEKFGISNPTGKPSGQDLHQQVIYVYPQDVTSKSLSYSNITILIQIITNQPPSL